MTFLPIVARELRIASRKRSTYWLRIGAALAILVLGSWFFLMMRTEAPSLVAKQLFGILTGTAVIYGLLSGVRETADSLSIEKREGTLGLLFLTDLKGYDVVLGKFAASSLNAFYGIFAVLPMLAIPLLMGGVTVGEFTRVSMVTVNSLFFSLSVGMFVSSMSKSARKAASLTFLTLLVITALFPALGTWLSYAHKITVTQRLMLLLPSPGYTYYSAWDLSFRILPAYFWWSLGVVHGLGWVCLALASLIAPHSWKDRPAGRHRMKWRERWQYWSHGNLVERRSFRNRLLDVNAFFWLSSRARLKPALVWTVLALLGCGWVWGWTKFQRDWLNVPMYLTTGIVLSIILKGWLASEAGKQLAEDRKLGALELLLSTPLTVQDILNGQLRSLRRQFFGPLLVVLVVACVLMRATALEEPGTDEYLLFWVGGMITLIADLVALYWVGMWQALNARNPNRAATATVARIMVVPGLAWAFMMLLISLGTVGSRGPGPSGEFILGAWFSFGIAADIGFSAWSRFKLMTEFRTTAARRYAPRVGFWKSFFSAHPSSEGLVSIPDSK